MSLDPDVLDRVRSQVVADGRAPTTGDIVRALRADGVLLAADDLLAEAAARFEALGRRVDLGRGLLDLAGAERPRLLGLGQRGPAVLPDGDRIEFAHPSIYSGGAVHVHVDLSIGEHSGSGTSILLD